MQEAPSQNRKRDSARRQAIIDAVAGAELTEYEAWQDLDVLSNHTFVDGVEVDPEGITLTADGRFRGLFNVYVALHYGDAGNDELVTSDSFEGSFNGHFEGSKPVLENMKVDTSRFYE